MRLAYADPPYPGESERHYGNHPDYAGEVDHAALIADLQGFDGWALSTSNKALRDVLGLCPSGVRVLAWCKPIAPPFPGKGVYGWEPVIARPARPVANDLRDTITVSPEMFTFRPKPAEYVTGMKPPAFCRWLFAWLGAQQDDTFDDMFPGSGTVGYEWARWFAQGRLIA